MQNNLNAQEAAYYGSCLKRRISKSEIEQHGFGSLPPKHPVLTELIENLAADDELWHFSSTPEHWKNLIGESGLAIVQDGAVIAVLVLLHN